MIPLFFCVVLCHFDLFWGENTHQNTLSGFKGSLFDFLFKVFLTDTRRGGFTSKKVMTRINLLMSWEHGLHLQLNYLKPKLCVKMTLIWLGVYSSGGKPACGCALLYWISAFCPSDTALLKPATYIVHMIFWKVVNSPNYTQSAAYYTVLLSTNQWITLLQQLTEWRSTFPVTMLRWI